jgi:hypothetical protein
MEMLGLKPSILMGKFKQHLPPGGSPDKDPFFGNVSDTPTTFHEGDGRRWQPQDRRGY